MAVVPGDLGELDLVQGHGDGAHVVLGQHQLQQPSELLLVQRRVPQGVGELVHDGAQQLPELAVLLGLLELPQGLQLRRPLLQPAGQVNLREKSPEGLQLPGGALPLLQSPGQTAQGAADPRPDGVDLPEGLRLLRGKVLLPPGGVGGPVLLPNPHGPVDVPGDDVVLQPVALPGGKASQPGLEVPEHVLVLIPAAHCVQGGGDEAQHRLLQHVAAAADIHRHAVALKDALDDRGILLQVPGGHRDVPEPELSRPRQGQDLGGHVLRLGKEALRPVKLYRLTVSIPLGAAAEEVGFQVLQGCLRRTGGEVDHPALCPLPVRQADQAVTGPETLAEDLQIAVPLPQEGDGDGPGPPQQDGDDRQLLGGEVGEAVEEDVLALGVPGGLQLLPQPGHQVPAVLALPLQAVEVRGVDQAQVPDLLPGEPAQAAPNLPQPLRLHPADLELVAQRHQLRQEGRLPGGAGVDRQGGQGLLEGPLHHQQLAPGVQCPVRRAAGPRQHPAGQQPEAQHLPVAGGGVTAYPAQIQLRLVGGVLRHQQQLSDAAVTQVPDLLQHPERLAGVGPPHPYFHPRHGALPLRRSSPAFHC